MEKPTIEQKPTPSPQESLETLNERMEVLQGIVEEFSKEVGPALREYENTSRKVFTGENGHNDSLQRKNLLDLSIKLAAFEVHLTSMFEVFERAGGGSGLNDLFTFIHEIQTRLAEAPDARHTHEALAEIHGGKRNIPAGRWGFENTQEIIRDFKGQIRGLQIALEFLHPKKVRQ